MQATLSINNCFSSFLNACEKYVSYTECDLLVYFDCTGMYFIVQLILLIVYKLFRNFTCD